MTNEAKILSIIALVSIFIVVGGALFLGNTPSTPKSKAVSENVLVTKDSEKIGSSSAKVTVVEFADFQCPACAAWAPTVSDIVQNNPDDVLLVFRHFPLQIHANAQAAAAAAEAAGKQGKFWDMYKILYQNQSEWSEEKDPTALFETYAKKLELDIEQWKKDMKSTAVLDEIKKDIADGYKAEVNQTPTFFVNNERVDTSSFDNLSQKVSEALQQ